MAEMMQRTVVQRVAAAHELRQFLRPESFYFRRTALFEGCGKSIRKPDAVNNDIVI